jgi:ABC-2 type transport system ATP-binding protein
MDALVIDNLSKSYGTTVAIDGVSFNVKEDSVHGFLGPNGAGKSTTMKIIAGLLAPDYGEVTVLGKKVSENLNEIKSMIGILPEEPPVYGDMVVREYLEFVAQINGVPKKSLKKMVDDCLFKTQLSSVAHRLIGNLSRGFKQRVGIAQALVFNPRILILDEPTLGLDPSSVIEVRNLIKELKKDHTIILSSHILHEVSLACDHITIINDGKIVTSDSLDEIHKRFKSANVVLAEVSGWKEKLKKEIEAIDFVESLETYSGDTGEQFLKVYMNTMDDMRAKLSKELVSKELGILSYKKEVPELENIFLEVTKS